MTRAEIDKLKTELHALNCRIQAERNDEVRHGLARIRLEAERAQLLVKLMDAQIALREPPPQVVVAEITPPPPLPAGATGKLASSPRKKPEGTPTLTAMVTTTLEEATKQGRDVLRPRDITAIIRDKWWPSLPDGRIASVMWHMAQAGAVEKRSDGYRLRNGHG